ncbi:MAG: TMEM175 family protein [Rubrivivax sp.]
MEKNRLEAFSDGVLAIIITIMVLELKVPHDDTPQALLQLWPVFLSYVLSFLYVGIYWNNHHHMMQAAHTVSGGVLWANLHLLFWLSLLPFTTGWMGENHFTRLPMVVYGFNLLMAALSYYVLQLRLAAHHGPGNAIEQALGRDVKGKASLVAYAAGTAAAWWVEPWMGFVVYAGVALMWLVPDRRMERAVHARNAGVPHGGG